MVHVQIDHQNFLPLSFIQQIICGNGYVVKDTKSFAFVRVGVVRTAGNVHGHPVLLSVPAAVDCPLSNDDFPVNQSLR